MSYGSAGRQQKRMTLSVLVQSILGSEYGEVCLLTVHTTFREIGCKIWHSILLHHQFVTQISDL